MLVSEVGLLVDETCGHHQMASHPVGVLLAQRLQLDPRALVQVARFDIVWKVGIVVTRSNGSELSRHPLFFGELPLEVTRIPIAACRLPTSGPQLLVTTATAAGGTLARTCTGALPRTCTRTLPIACPTEPATTLLSVIAVALLSIPFLSIPRALTAPVSAGALTVTRRRATTVSAGALTVTGGASAPFAVTTGSPLLPVTRASS
jgi:hypothetical protein